MLDHSQASRIRNARSARLWSHLRHALITTSAISLAAATVIGARAQELPDPVPTLQALPAMPRYAPVALPDDPFEPLVATLLTVETKTTTTTTSTTTTAAPTTPTSQAARTPDPGLETQQARLCGTFLNAPATAVVELGGNYLRLDLKDSNRIGTRRVVAIGANAIQLENGTIIEQGDCEAATTQTQPPQQQTSDPTTTTTTTTTRSIIAPGANGSLIPYAPNQNGVLVPGPSANPYDQGPANPNQPQPNNPYNSLYGQTPPPQSGFPPFVRVLPKPASQSPTSP